MSRLPAARNPRDDGRETARIVHTIWQMSTKQAICIGRVLKVLNPTRFAEPAVIRVHIGVVPAAALDTGIAFGEMVSAHRGLLALRGGCYVEPLQWLD